MPHDHQLIWLQTISLSGCSRCRLGLACHILFQVCAIQQSLHAPLPFSIVQEHVMAYSSCSWQSIVFCKEGDIMHKTAPMSEAVVIVC